VSRKDWHRPDKKEIQKKQGMRRIAMKLAYKGTNFVGWQTQVSGRSVQEELEKSIFIMIGEEVRVQGSGRTDSGVHAMGQVCHFDIKNSTIPVRAFKYGMKIPKDITILDCWEPEDIFHARFTAMAREYKYFFKQSSDFVCFQEGLVTKIRKFPSLRVMNSYAEIVKGTHDFSTFTASGDSSLSRFRDVYESIFTMEKDVYGKPVMVYTISGNAFLYKMVRSLVGTMMTLGLKNENAESFKKILESNDRSRALVTAESQGLYLWRISYDKEEYRWFEDESE